MVKYLGKKSASPESRGRLSQRDGDFDSLARGLYGVGRRQSDQMGQEVTSLLSRPFTPELTYVDA